MMSISEALAIELVGTRVQRGPMLEGTPPSVVDTRWIKGIKGSWKRLVKAVKDPAIAQGKASSIDFDLLKKTAETRQRALMDAMTYVRALRADLNINKRMWTDVAPKDAKGVTEKFRSKVQAELDAAESAIAEGVDRIRFWVNVLTLDSHEYKLDGGFRYKDATASLEGFQRFLNSVNGAAIEAMTTADAAISRKLMRHLGKHIVKVPPPPGQKTGGREIPINMGSYEPDVVKLGKVTVMFDDGPAAQSSPIRARARSRTDHMGGTVQERPRNPRDRERYIKLLLKARAILKRRGLDYLWYGRIVVMCKSCGGTNTHGASFGVGAHYHRMGDWVSIYNEPTGFIPELIAHEFGHRYYYKFMSATDRGRFNQWFGDVKAVSKYGGTSTEEDFAEVFAWYIDGKNLDRDQLARFKAFLGKSRKLERKEESPLARLTA